MDLVTHHIGSAKWDKVVELFNENNELTKYEVEKNGIYGKLVRGQTKLDWVCHVIWVGRKKALGRDTIHCLDTDF